MKKLTEKRSQALKWWYSLSINEMKLLEKKHRCIYDHATSREIEEIYGKEKGHESN